MVDLKVDRLWIAVHRRLDAFKGLPEGSPRKAEGLRLRDLVFADGLGFIKKVFLVQHAEGQRRLDLLEPYDAQLRDLVGDDFVDELLAAHAEYGKALGITAPKPEGAPEPESLAAPKEALVEAIRAYSMQMLAYADQNRKKRPEIVAKVAKALGPIEEFRAANKRGQPQPEDAPTADSPVPSLPDADESD